MKKSLAVRAGAVVMVLVIAFFMILPDMVNAEGDGDQEPTTEMASSQNTESSGEPVPETPSTEVSPAPSTEVQTTENAEPTVPETPPSEEPSPETPSEVPSETPTEPSDENTITQPSAPETVPSQPDTAVTDTDPVQPEIASSEVPTEPEEGAELLEPEWSVETKTVTPLDDEVENLEVNTDNSGFIIEGTTITGYQGPGGNIVIPEGITAIADNAFYGNSSITGVTFPGSLTTIGSSAFNGCSNIESIAIPGSVSAIGVSAFANCTGLGALSLSPSAGTVGEGVFYNCISLTSVTIPEGISSIASEAFGACVNLNDISLPSSLTSLNTNAFAGDTNLTSIAVADGNGSYSSHDGCVYTAGGGQILLCPQGKTSVSFLSGMSSVASGAFSGCRYISAIVIPSSASTIEANAFSGSGIKSVTIPASVTSIGTQADWTPDVIYGYTGSVAESWADENNYIFESLNSVPGENPGEDTEDPGEGPDDNPGTGGGNGGGNGGSVQSQTGVSTTTVTAAGPSGNHVKDATPKTGVEDYGIYYLLGAILLIGAACFAYSKKIHCDEQ